MSHGCLGMARHRWVRQRGAAWQALPGRWPMISHRPDLYRALRDVGEHQIIFYPGLAGGHPVGYGWLVGGDPSAEEQNALAELECVHLIVLMPARVAGQIGSVVDLTPEGRWALSVWDARVDAEGS